MSIMNEKVKSLIRLKIENWFKWYMEIGKRIIE